MRLAPGPAKIIDEVPHGRLHLDGDILVPAGDSAMRDRKKAAALGVVFAAVVMTDSGEFSQVTEAAYIRGVFGDICTVHQPAPPNDPDSDRLLASCTRVLLPRVARSNAGSIVLDDQSAFEQSNGAVFCVRRRVNHGQRRTPRDDSQWPMRPIRATNQVNNSEALR